MFLNLTVWNLKRSYQFHFINRVLLVLKTKYSTLELLKFYDLSKTLKLMDFFIIQKNIKSYKQISKNYINL